ncbi:MAG TPA: galactosyltransferase-related protein, partial [Patescibacteria group bacterium]|nr:galactosyltransferase-related protein [Patescibacteria group bacterium]
MFSIIMPLDENRLNQFKNTKLVYDSMPQKKEFIIPTRNERGLRKYFSEHKLDKDVRIIPYVVRIGFNCSKALNLGVRSAKYPQIIVTSPEVLPITQVLAQFEEVLGTNVVGQVWDGDENGNKGKSLVSTHFRNNNPGMYFLAMFNKDDIEKVNGWDEEFMKGYAYEDKDFGERFRRAGIPFTVRDDIQALHQYHPRSETIPGGLAINRQRLIDNH